MSCLLQSDPGPHLWSQSPPLTLIVLIATQSHFDGRVESAIQIIVLATLLCGSFQILLGLLRMGRLIRYVPFPVIAGFMNGIALMLIIKQLKTFMGLPRTADLTDFGNVLQQLQWPTLLVGILTLGTILTAKKYYKKIPASIVGLFLGIVYNYGAKVLCGESTLGPAIGRLQSGFPLPYLLLQFKAAITTLPLMEFLPDILLAGVVLGLIGSIESLFSAVVSDDMSGTRHNSNRELIAQGCGNIACSLFGPCPAPVRSHALPPPSVPGAAHP